MFDMPVVYSVQLERILVMYLSAIREYFLVDEQ